jgi:hypothetical protein
MSCSVASQTGLVQVLGRQLAGSHNLGWVAAGLNVRLAVAVAVLAGHTFASVHLCEVGVRIIRKLIDHIRVAGSALVGCRIGGRSGILCGSGDGLSSTGSEKLHRPTEHSEHCNHRETKKPAFHYAPYKIFRTGNSKPGIRLWNL